MRNFVPPLAASSVWRVETHQEGEMKGALGVGLEAAADALAAGQKAKPPFGVLSQACSLPLSPSLCSGTLI